MSNRRPEEVSQVNFGNAQLNATFFALATVILLSALIWWSVRGWSTGSSLDSSFPLVLGLMVLTSGLLFIAGFRFPYRIGIEKDTLVVHYLHGRRESIQLDRIQELELRGTYLGRNVWISFRDGSSKPLGTRNRDLVLAWKRYRRG